ncbi:unnamed protein product [marine sediment metagenome]|uniref:Uncharacterized protein n=1 Tax=marine sediment metagenome TaxID=412755 RepID=X1UVM5_9ZZZZ
MKIDFNYKFRKMDGEIIPERPNEVDPKDKNKITKKHPAFTLKTLCVSVLLNAGSDDIVCPRCKHVIKKELDLAGDGGGGLGRLDVDEDFEGLNIGTIDGQRSYNGWGTWVVAAGANTSAEIVDIGGDYHKILRLARTEGSNQVKCGLDFNDTDNNWGLRSGFYIRLKVRANPDNLELLWFSLRQ